MEYHPLLTIEPFQLWLPDILMFLIFKTTKKSTFYYFLREFIFANMVKAAFNSNFKIY